MRKVINGLSKGSVAIAAVCIFAMMIIITYDAALRYFFGASTSIAYNVSEIYLMPAIIFFGLGYTQMLGGHTRVVFFFRFFNPVVKKLLLIIAHLATIFVFCLITMEGYKLTMRAWSNMEIFTGTYSWPMYIAYIIIPVSCGIMVLQSLLDLYDTIRDVQKEEPVEYNERDIEAKYDRI
ncbi:MAG: TRAP transporter small permease [Bacillota bacterium]|jgi:TRAP-type C4-dicarboxylate transport system permease small subunit